MSKTAIMWLAAFFILISVTYTVYGYLQKSNAKQERFKKYVPAKAVIDDVFPVRVSRYGAKAGHVNLTILAADGKKISRVNCHIGDNYKVHDTITVYYDPSQPTDSEVVTKIP